MFIDFRGRLIDSAPVYCDAEQVLGNLMKDLGITEKTFVATKVRTRGRRSGENQFQTSERLLKKRPLDLSLVHSLVDVQTQLDNLSRWREAGRVRYIGITHSRVSAFR